MTVIFIEKIKHFLSGKKVSLSIILLAITGRIIQLVYFFNIRVDGMYQHLATLNFINGHGISTGYVLPKDLSSTIYEPLINWPPGYSLLLTPFYLLFNNNYIAAGLTLDILAAITLILVSRKILHLFNTPIYLINTCTIITGFYIYYFYLIASSDAIAIAIFVTGLYFSLSLIKTSQAGIKNTVAFTLAFIFCGLIKYLFFPIVLIIPAYLIAKGISNKNVVLKKAGILSLSLVIVVLGSLLLYQKSITGTAGYISQPARGFYPTHILSAYPLIPASFIQPESILILLNQTQYIYLFILRFLQILNAFFLILSTLFITKNRYLVELKKTKLLKDFLYIVYFISVAITLLLLILSLWVEKEEILPGYFWTYIEDPRYYGLPVVLLQLLFFISYGYSYTASKLQKYFFSFLLLLLLSELFRGGIFTVNRLTNLKKEEYSWQYEDRFQKYAVSLIKKERNNDENAVITGPPYTMTNRISLYSGFPVLNDAVSINTPSSLNSKKPILLLVVLHKINFVDYNKFLSYGYKSIGSFGDYHFFSVHIKPH